MRRPKSGRKREWCTLLFLKTIRVFVLKKARVHHSRSLVVFAHTKKGPGKLRARRTLFWPKIAREATKFNETRTIRSEIARGIVSTRSQGPEMDKMRVFSIFSAIEMALQLPRRGNSIQRQICARQVQARGLQDTLFWTRIAPENIVARCRGSFILSPRSHRGRNLQARAVETLENSSNKTSRQNQFEKKSNPGPPD